MVATPTTCICTCDESIHSPRCIAHACQYFERMKPACDKCGATPRDAEGRLVRMFRQRTYGDPGGQVCAACQKDKPKFHRGSPRPAHLDYSTPCPLDASERHAWEVDPSISDRLALRYRCKCEAMAWQQIGGPVKEPTPIRQYAPGSGEMRALNAKRRREARRPKPPITAGPHAGSNASGHRLPASGGSR